MKKYFNRLSAKILLSIVLWLIGALMFTGLTLNLTWELENGGVMINQAGSLRMRINHLALQASMGSSAETITEEYEEYEEILNHLERMKAQSWLADNEESKQKISNVKNLSQVFIIEILGNTAQIELTQNAKVSAEALIVQIDQLVNAIESTNTHNIRLLRIFQFTLICMVILSAFITLLFLNRLVIHPLNALNMGIQKISKGQLNAKITEIPQDEFGEVALGFNKMAANLKDLYENLEQKVQTKTIALQERNSELKLLYEVTAFLHEAQGPEEMINGFLEKIIAISKGYAGVLCVLEDSNRELESIYHRGFSEESALPPLLTINEYLAKSRISTMDDANLPLTNKCIAHYREQFRHDKEGAFRHSVTFHVSHNSEVGYLNLYFQHPPLLDDKNIQLICVLTHQLAVAIENQRLVTLNKHLAILEERNLMAQDLHDNIAQSLSFLNMQAQMLKDALEKNNSQQALENAKFIQKGIQESYEDVRELLLNFRTKINTEDFEQTIQSVIQRFKRQTNIPVMLKMLSKGADLDIGQHLQVVFILQEALSNVRKHAQTKQVNITIEQDDNFRMRIQDDGIGFSFKEIQEKKEHHVGIGIMQERAKRADGIMQITSIPKQGTVVELSIPIATNRGETE